MVPRPPKDENRSQDFQSILDLGDMDRVILTLARASLMENIYTDVLVVASGQGWPDALAGFPPRSWCRDHPVVVVDLADDYDGDARQATLSRQRAYASRGWHELKAPAWMRQVP